MKPCPTLRRRTAGCPGTALGAPTRIVILGGGFAGVILTRQLEKLVGARRDVEIVLVSRDNYFLITPLLFEACSGTLELRHCSQPIRPFLRHAQFIEASVDRIDLDRRTVSSRWRKARCRTWRTTTWSLR